MKQPKIYGVVLAGGVGSRMRQELPKQLLKIAGKTILEHTLENFGRNRHFDELIIVSHPRYKDEILEILSSVDVKIKTRMVDGGKTRSDSTENALKLIRDDEAKVLIHDAVRPFVDERMVDEMVEKLDEYRVIDIAIPSADTLIRVDENRIITEVPNRDLMRRAQTPQAFRVGTLKRAYALARKDPNFQAADDCSVVFRYLPDEKIYVVDGTSENMKITEPIDWQIADKVFQLRQKIMKVDVAVLKRDLKGKNIVFFGGGSGIGLRAREEATKLGAKTMDFSLSTTGTDIGDHQEIAEALKVAAERFGQIDIVIVTAGVLLVEKLAKTSFRSIEQQLRTNLLGSIFVAKTAFSCLKQSCGKLILFSSSSYTRGREDYSLYSAAKAGIVNLVQALSEEWYKDQVRVDCIVPSRTATNMRLQAFGEEPKGTLLDPRDVAMATLMSAVSRETGQIIDVRIEKDRTK